MEIIMSVEMKLGSALKKNESRILYVRLAGKLSSKDYEYFVPKIESAIQEHGKIRIILELIGFHGWTAGALWEDIKFDAKHFDDIERLAIVGDRKWEKGMAVFCKPFTTADIRYFDISRIEEAQSWIKE
jgi:hypothetical protein